MTTTTKRPRILLVDDDRSFAKIIANQAHTMSIDLEFASSVSNARSINSLTGVDLLLIDYDLDDGTGFEAAEHFMQKAKDMPVVMISSTNRPQQDRLGALPNIVGFVSKWARPHEFLSHVITVARTRPRISPIAISAPSPIT
jgi:two-component system response regulator HydG